MGLHQSKIGLESVNELDWSGKDILDIGCGDGELILEILETTNCRRVVGVDLDDKEIKKAKLLAKKNSSKEISFRQGNASDLSFFTNSSYDIIFSNIAFQQFEDKLTALREMFRVLKPGGEVILNFIEEKSDVRKEIDRLVSEPPFNEIIKTIEKGKKISRKEFVGLAREAGFRIISSVSKADVLYYPTIGSLLNGYKNFDIVFPQLKKLSQEMINDLWKKLTDEFERRKNKQGYGETWQVVFAQLRKK